MNFADFFKIAIPACCPGCGEEFFPERYGSLCSRCIERLLFFDPSTRCPGCGGKNDSVMEFCHQCSIEEKRPWQYALAVFAYQSFGKELVQKFKFGGRSDLARPFGLLASELLKSVPIHPDIIVPIPISPLRYLRRSYNQTELIAQIVSKNSGIPVKNAISRRFTLRRQSALSRKKRHSGIKKTFYLKNSDGLYGKKILLLDDILTTGSTLTAAAQLLTSAGCSEITVLVIARAISRY